MKYIFFSIVLLSLIGIGEKVHTYCFQVKYDKESELVQASRSFEKNTKSFEYTSPIDAAVISLKPLLWSKANLTFYHQSVQLIIRTQTDKFSAIGSFHIVHHPSYFPRKSIEIPSIS